MKSIGQVIKETRIRKKISLSHLSSVTKIKEEFLASVEQGQWNLLPEYPVVVGFVKNISVALSLNPKSSVALLRRDYPPKELKINPKPDVAKEFIWSPKLTFLVGIVIVVLGVFGYLIFQYINFISPPELNVDVPTMGQTVNTKNLTVSGKTDPEATVVVNNQPILLDENGHFSTEIEVFDGTKEVTVIAKSRSGKETAITRKIEVELKK